MTQELIRRIDNIVQIGTVCEIKSDQGKALARVDINGRVTDFLPVLLWNSDHLKVWLPIRIGQQVSVLHPFGDGNFGLILPGIYHKRNKEPEGANEKNIIFEIAFEDTKIRCRIEDGDIFVDLQKGSKVGSFVYENGALSLKAQSVKIDANNIELTGEVKVGKNLHVSQAVYDELGDLTHHGHPR